MDYVFQLLSPFPPAIIRHFEIKYFLNKHYYDYP